MLHMQQHVKKDLSCPERNCWDSLPRKHSCALCRRDPWLLAREEASLAAAVIHAMQSARRWMGGPRSSCYTDEVSVLRSAGLWV